MLIPVLRAGASRSRPFCRVGTVRLKACGTEVPNTVGDFLQLTDETRSELGPDRLSYSCTAALDKCLQRFPGLPENRHAALGTAVPTWLLRVVGATALAHPIGVVCFCCAYHAIACANVL